MSYCICFYHVFTSLTPSGFPQGSFPVESKQHTLTKYTIFIQKEFIYKVEYVQAYLHRQRLSVLLQNISNMSHQRARRREVQVSVCFYRTFIRNHLYGSLICYLNIFSWNCVQTRYKPRRSVSTSQKQFHKPSPGVCTRGTPINLLMGRFTDVLKSDLWNLVGWWLLSVLISLVK